MKGLHTVRSSLGWVAHGGVLCCQDLFGLEEWAWNRDDRRKM